VRAIDAGGAHSVYAQARVSHRREQKAAAREARLGAEREAASRDTRRRRLTWLGAALAAIAVAAVLIIVLAGGGDDGGGGDSAAGVQGATDSRAMLAGIQQDGASLGDPDAPVVLTEFADLQCPFCRDYALNVLPRVIEKYVRRGDLRLELRLLRFIGPDSDRGARAAVVASRQDKMWDFVDLFYRNQGKEGTGYADDSFIRDIAQAAGVPPQEAIDGISAADTEAPIAEAEQQATAAGIQSTPSFTVNREGEEPKRIELTQITAEAMDQALEPYLGK
jgi:protein-disulfide isomerase